MEINVKASKDKIFRSLDDEAVFSYELSLSDYTELQYWKEVDKSVWIEWEKEHRPESHYIKIEEGTLEFDYADDCELAKTVINSGLSINDYIVSGVTYVN